MGPDILTAVQVAAQLGVSAQRVRFLATERGLGHHFGHVWAFTAADVEALRVKGIGGRKVKEVSP